MTGQDILSAVSEMLKRVNEMIDRSAALQSAYAALHSQMNLLTGRIEKVEEKQEAHERSYRSDHMTTREQLRRFEEMLQAVSKRADDNRDEIEAIMVEHSDRIAESNAETIKKNAEFARRIERLILRFLAAGVIIIPALATAAASIWGK